jgi:hypothetical protein
MGEKGNDTLRKIFTERFRSGSGQSQRSPTAVICGERERAMQYLVFYCVQRAMRFVEREKEEERKKKSPTKLI